MFFKKQQNNQKLLIPVYTATSVRRMQVGRGSESRGHLGIWAGVLSRAKVWQHHKTLFIYLINNA